MYYCTGCGNYYGCEIEKKFVLCEKCEKTLYHGYCYKKIFANIMRAKLGYCKKCKGG